MRYGIPRVASQSRLDSRVCRYASSSAGVNGRAARYDIKADSLAKYNQPFEASVTVGVELTPRPRTFATASQ